MPTRLTLICHAATAATRAAAFPGADDALDGAALAKAALAKAALTPMAGRIDAAWSSPARAARDTAAALGLTPALDPALADLDAGSWSARSLDAVAATDPTGLAAWLADPDAAPHGGETVRQLIARAAAWLGALDPTHARVVAITHSSILRAALVTALGAPPAAFWRIDVAPLCRLRLNRAGAGWTLRALGK